MSRDYVFTSWELPEPRYDELRYICWGFELCPTTNRKHYQGFACFKRTHRIPSAKRILGGGDTAHLETRRGTRREAMEYCRKDGKFFEWGQFEPLTVKDILLTLKPKEIAKEYPELYCRYDRGIHRMLALNHGDKWRDVKVTWLWGKPGCGKTRHVMEYDDVFKLDYPYKWWDGYDENSILLLDDFRFDTKIDTEYLLNLLDGYRMRLETKGGHCWAHWKEVYVTSNYPPPLEQVYGLRRRIHEIIECDKCQD